MSTYLNGISPYNNVNTNYGTGFSLSNYTNLSTPGLSSGSIFDGYNSAGNISPMAPQVQPPQQNNGSSDESMMQLLMAILPLLLGQTNGANNQTTVVDEIVDESEDHDIDDVDNHEHPVEPEETAHPEKVSTVDKIAKTAGEIAAAPVKIGVEVIKQPVKALGKLFKGW